jgi:hypothetical protein
VRGEEERDSAFGVQRGEWVEQWRFGQAIGWILWRLLRWRMQLPLRLQGPLHCGWRLSAHYEHTVVITRGELVLLTAA